MYLRKEDLEKSNEDLRILSKNLFQNLANQPNINE
jgi:hypothetical protein